MAEKTDADRVAASCASAPRFAGNVSDQTAVDYLVAVRAAERSRIADHLHDTTCQKLAILQLNLGRIRRVVGGERDAILLECEEIVATIGREIREVADQGA